MCKYICVYVHTHILCSYLTSATKMRETMRDYIIVNEKQIVCAFTSHVTTSIAILMICYIWYILLDVNELKM